MKTLPGATRAFAFGVVCAMTFAFIVLGFSGYRDPSLYLVAAGTSLVGGLFLLVLYFYIETLRRYFDDMSNFRGGRPKGPHPLPVNDAHLLNRRHRSGQHRV